MGNLKSMYYKDTDVDNNNHDRRDNIISDVEDTINGETNNIPYKEIYCNKELSYMNNSNISLQNSFNKYSKNKLLDNFNKIKHGDGWTSEIFLFVSGTNNLIKKIYNKNLDLNILHL